MPTIKGKLNSFNVSPKGFYESFLVDDGKRLVQINFAPEAGETAAKGLKLGRTISVEVEELDNPRDAAHPVFLLVDQSRANRRGVVKQLNYSRHGEVNGAILKGGDFVHMRPDGAKSVPLKVGQKLSIEGEARLSPSGQMVIEAMVVNGVKLGGHQKAAKKAARHAHA